MWCLSSGLIYCSEAIVLGQLHDFPQSIWLKDLHQIKTQQNVDKVLLKQHIYTPFG